MGEILLPQEIIEQVLQYADGETLLTCREVSPEFAAAVNYLGKTKNIWKKCYAKEKGDKYPYCVISKVHPHNEGFEHPKNWGVIYESSLLGNFIFGGNTYYLEAHTIGKEYSDIVDIETHEDLILVLVKYSKNFSNYYKIITINLQNDVIDKSCKFYASRLYITPVENSSSIKGNAILLSCDYCHLAAVPISTDMNVVGYPKFSVNDDYLTVELSTGGILWINAFGNLITKGKCFHTGTTAKHEEIKLKDSKSVKVHQRFTILYISSGNTKREFNTFKKLQANITASLVYSNVLIVGTDTGRVYAYSLTNESEIKKLDLKNYIWHFDICCSPILVINVMDLKTQFVVVCCSKKVVYHVHIKRKLQDFCF